MEKDWQVKAHLDDYDRIVVYIATSFYFGKSNEFFLKDEKGFLNKCLIRSIENHSQYTKYDLDIPFPIQFGVEYILVEEHARQFPLHMGRIVKTKRFDDEFFYEGNDLGAVYSKEKTVFTLWAPTATAVLLNLEHENEFSVLPMKREEKGIYRLSVEGDLKDATYTYFVKVNGHMNEACDPYSYSLTCNGTRSAVIDLSQVNIETKGSQCLPLSSMTDAIIMEANVRDFTSFSGLELKNKKGTFKAMTETGLKVNGQAAGFDYLKELGITHLQLQPVLEYVTVDEENPEVFYNWGYDANHYFSLEGSYSSDAKNPYARIIEFKELVRDLHQAHIRVCLDVVFNHVYDMPSSNFEKIVPLYYFRVSETGYVSNGSFCGNDLDSTRKMMRKHILDSCKMLVKEYGVDGFRFDLMGILDIETMNQIVSECRQINSSFICYGEGWNMPTALKEEDKAIQANNSKMPLIAHFNDFFRDKIKGRSSENESMIKGFCTGNVFDIYDVQDALLANCVDHINPKIYGQPFQSINYVECHDNQTCYDKIFDCCKEESEAVRIKRQKLMIGMLMCAQGVPFFQCGQEFCRTKNGLHNTYRSPDQINQIDWVRKNKFMDTVEYTKACIQLRKSIPAFRMKSSEEIRNHITFEVYENEVLIYKLNHLEKYGDYHEILVLFNSGFNEYAWSVENEYQLIFDEQGFVQNRRSENYLKSTSCSMRIYAR